VNARNDSRRPQPPRRPPLQFGLKSLLGAVTAAAVLFGVLRWFGASPMTTGLVLLLLVLGALAAAALAAAISAAGADDDFS
jgi:hypothetical protein